jgi:hypothetical protein
LWRDRFRFGKAATAWRVQVSSVQVRFGKSRQGSLGGTGLGQTH